MYFSCIGLWGRFKRGRRGDEKMEVSSPLFYHDILMTCEGKYMITILELKLSLGSNTFLKCHIVLDPVYHLPRFS